MDFTENLMHQIIALALAEDKVDQDITTLSLLEFDNLVTARVIAKADGVISGIPVFSETMKKVDPGLSIRVYKGDGSPVQKGDLILEIAGRESSILRAERTALNFLQRLSGIATLTRQYAAMLAPTGVILLDTRKTTPGLRYLEKKAVTDGGGTNHRLNLEDMAMVKDNHIEMAGSITRAVQKVKEKYPGKKIEVEVKNLAELDEALSLQVDVIMLDNFDPALLPQAVEKKNKRPYPVKFELSGNVNLDNIAAKALPGIDFISVGALTHSFHSLDISLEMNNEQ